jgi:phage terminase large subunit-like protein
VVPHFWLPEETVQDREREGFTAYQTWADEGLLTITEGGAIDYDRVFKDIRDKIAPRFPLLKQGEIGYDPAFATDIANRLRDKAGFNTVEVLQNYKHLSEPSQVFEALVKTRRVIHDGHRLLRWNVENVAIKQDDAGRIRPVKPRKQAKKIDGVVASLMGIARLQAMPEPKERSFAVEWLE